MYADELLYRQQFTQYKHVLVATSAMPRAGPVQPFDKPDFKSVDELMYAFSTHVVDTFTGLERERALVEIPRDPFKYQRLVFFHSQPESGY